MKWWGWGAEGTEFDIESKPELWPYMKKILGITEEPKIIPPVDLEQIALSEPNINPRLSEFVQSILREDQLNTDNK